MSYTIESMEILKWRKIENVTVKIGKKLTLISGHNGIGKSNILSIVSSSAGTKTIKTSSGKNFQPEIGEYFYIDPDEVKNGYETFINYKYIDKNKEEYLFIKRMRLKDDTKFNRGIRLIPETTNNGIEIKTNKTKKTIQEEVKKITLDGVGPEGRVPIPSIYLSIARLYPLGETVTESKELSTNTNIMQKTGNEVFRDWYNKVLPGSIKKEENKFYRINKKVNGRKSYTMNIKNTNHLSQSIGQDNLGNIISALVEFYLINDREEDYQGGVLCIDEIDVSLHPNAQINLINLLDEVSEQLNLQIIMSSHSLVIIEEFIRKKRRQEKINSNGNKINNYEVNYFKNIDAPFCTEFFDMNSIKADLYQELVSNKPKIKIYFEDDVGEYLFKKLVSCYESLEIEEKKSSLLKDTFTVNAYLGCSNLEKLNKVDQYFKSTLIILDGDFKTKEGVKPEILQEIIKNKSYNQTNSNLNIKDKKKIPKNIICLPKYYSPEFYLYCIVKQFVDNESDYVAFWRGLDTNPETTNYTAQIVRNEIYLKDGFDNNDIKKKFKFIKEFIDKTSILDIYYGDKENKKELIEFINNYYKAKNELGKELYAKLY